MKEFVFLQYREYTLSELLIVKRIKHTEKLCVASQIIWNGLKQTWIWSVGEWLDVMGSPSIGYHIDSHTHCGGDGLILVRGNLHYQVILWNDHIKYKVSKQQWVSSKSICTYLIRVQGWGVNKYATLKKSCCKQFFSSAPLIKTKGRDADLIWLTADLWIHLLCVQGQRIKQDCWDTLGAHSETECN